MKSWIYYTIEQNVNESNKNVMQQKLSKLFKGK